MNQKIAHICTSGISHKIMGDKLRLLQQQEGVQVTFISSPEGVDAELMKEKAYPFEWKLLPMARSIQPVADLRSILAMYKLFRRERYDIVHTHTAKAGLIGRIAAKLARVPVVIHTSHGLPFYEGQPRKTYWLYKMLEKFGAACCDALASQNEEDAGVLRKLAPWRPVFVEGNGVDLKHLDELAGSVTPEQTAALRRKHGIDREEKVLFMAARFEPVKDHSLLLDALSELKRVGALNWVTVLAGQGPLEAEIKLQAEMSGLEDDVLFVGQQSSIIPWLVMADAVTLTSEKEGIPRSLMEAMALSKPVVATKVLGTRELVAHAETGLLVPYRDSMQLGEALAAMMNTPEARKRMGDAGRRRIEAAFTEARVVERLMRLYRSTKVQVDRSRGLGARLNAFGKRLFDLIASVPAALLLSPVMLVVALLVKLKLGSPVLFKQQRPGRYGSPFYVLKFRTMRDAYDRFGQPLPDEARLTSFGKLLRKLSLDELPQLFNVIRGDMSLVGPRPLLMEYLPLYTEEQAHRHDVRPGITGWAQVNGRNAVSWEDKFKLDLAYVERRSIWFDLRILVRTVGKVLKRDGISSAGQATVQKFTGSREMGNAS
ncbi:lipopolysaccharide/colanic/teichoic acid biosynthesis glycosyltransferase/glycosyltransferase involved in cell wall biosynthesis [Paenibacillus sp. BK720]|nr:lipopolysaccharide/colanic/teichoic acid biosynthesis glycosyltransferase/glycosyltransferase involved in cell wall biosynthesis [Paenibacillus sp. BK720]